MSGLFDEYDEQQRDTVKPLAERVRPKTIGDVVGQDHLLGENAPLRLFVDRGTLPSMILWGPPGTGKTTLAMAISNSIGMAIERISAVESGVKELRAIIERASRMASRGERLVFFVDEIHRFNKAQQDALLHAVERGIVILIGATTENPSFEVNSALLSRCQVYRLQSLEDADIKLIVERAMTDDAALAARNIRIEDWDALIGIAGGDARAALNAVETAGIMADVSEDGYRVVSREVLRAAVQRRVVAYDRAGDAHYDTISAFIKSMRGSDPDAALYYLAIMIEAGEDPVFIARRLIVFASEDVGNAEPRALQLAVATSHAVERIGMPEGRIPLGQCTTFLASAPKSNASYKGIDAALKAVREGGDIKIPDHLRNAPTQLMKDYGHGAGYRYPHAEAGAFARGVKYLPEGVHGPFYVPTDHGSEAEIKDRLRSWWPETT